MLNATINTEFGPQSVEAETVEGISKELAAIGYEGATVKVYDEPGFVRGYASATEWRAA